VTPEDEQLLDLIRGTFSELARDGTRLRTHLLPSPSSPLAVDDDESWQRLPLSQHVWTCLGAAFDHLDLFRSTIVNEKTYPTATYSVLRGGLVGACQALWLLADNDPAERQERGRRFSQEWYEQRIQWQKTFTPKSNPSVKSSLLLVSQLSADDAARSIQQVRLLESDLERLKAARTSKKTFNTTELVTSVAPIVFPAEIERQRTLPREWRRLGGDAHALGWTFMTQAPNWGQRDPDGKTRATVEASVESLANSYLTALTVDRRAWIRLDELLLPKGAD
jgi:hypothetical protein